MEKQDTYVLISKICGGYIQNGLDDIIGYCGSNNICAVLLLSQHRSSMYRNACINIFMIAIIMSLANICKNLISYETKYMLHQIGEHEKPIRIANTYFYTWSPSLT